MIRFVAATRTAVLVTAWLIGAPILLTGLAGAPLPDSWPTTQQITGWWQAPLDPAYKAVTARLLAWLIWALTAAALGAVLTAQVRRLPWSAITAWLPPPIQGLTAALVGTAAITTTAAAPAAATTPGTATVSTIDAHLQPATVNDRATTSSAPAAIATVAPRTRQVAAQRPPVYIVTGGDWMAPVAERFLGDQDRYSDIARLNPGWERRDHRFPDHWEPGWKIVLPGDARDRGPRRHAAGHLVTPAPPAPIGQQPDTGGSVPPADTDGEAPPGESSPPPSAAASSSSRAPASQWPDSDGVASEPTVAPSPPVSATAPGAASSSGPQANAPNADDRPGITVPGGWVGLPLAAALVAAAAMVWQRRRHRYAPPPVGTERVDDPDLRPLPPVVSQLRRGVAEHSPDLLDPPAASPTVADYAEAGQCSLPAVGPSGADLAGHTGPLPAGGLGLTGPGAEPAARALLVATLSAGSPTDPDARGHVVVPADTLTALLGAHAAQIGTLPRLTVTPTLAEALTRLEELLIARRRQLHEYDAADLSDLRAADPYHPPMPPVLLLTALPPPQLQARLSTTLQLGHALQINAVLLGTWPHGDTITVTADGHPTPADHPRLAVLSRSTTVQLLTVLREAQTGQPNHPEPDTGTPTSGAPANAAPRPQQPALRTGNDEAVDPTTEPIGPVTAVTDLAVDTSSAADQRPVTPAPVSETAAESAAAPDDGPASSGPGGAELARPAQRRAVRIRLLGEPSILDRDGSPVTGLRRHARQLLVYLAVHRDGADLDDIMEAFWPTALVRRAAERLSTEVGNLRGRIRQAAGDTTIEPVINTGGRYVLNAAVLDIDLWRMSDALRRASTATDPATQITALREAIDVHTGGLADRHDYDWIEQPREQIRRQGVRTRLHLADLLAEQDPHQAATLAQAAAELDEYNEQAARHAMQKLARIGDITGIQAQLQRLHDALADIDEEPSEETTTLAAQLQRQLRVNVRARDTRPGSANAASPTKRSMSDAVVAPAGEEAHR